jgi:hypothetical protein
MGGSFNSSASIDQFHMSRSTSLNFVDEIVTTSRHTDTNDHMDGSYASLVATGLCPGISSVSSMHTFSSVENARAGNLFQLEITKEPDYDDSEYDVEAGNEIQRRNIYGTLNHDMTDEGPYSQGRSRISRVATMLGIVRFVLRIRNLSSISSIDYSSLVVRHPRSEQPPSIAHHIAQHGCRRCAHLHLRPRLLGRARRPRRRARRARRLFLPPLSLPAQAPAPPHPPPAPSLTASSLRGRPRAAAPGHTAGCGAQ